jgi:plastocyanin
MIIILIVLLILWLWPKSEFFKSDCKADCRIHDVKIVDFEYKPETVQIAPGDCVRWTNLDSVYHTATHDSDQFNSGNLYQNDCYVQKFKTKGTNPYYCIPHPYMKGKVVVK